MNETLSVITNSLRDFASGDIKKSLEKDMLIASCMLCVCFIDSVSGYYCGIDHFRNGKEGKKHYNVGNRYKQFCKDYLQERIDKRYTPELLYHNLRNNLVHSYSGTKNFGLTKGIPEHYHLQEDETGCVLFIVEVFYSHVNIAFEDWVKDLKSDKKLIRKALDWYGEHPILQKSEQNI